MWRLVLHLVIGLWFLRGSVVNAIEIYVDQARGADNESCWTGEYQLPCGSLDLALTGAGVLDNVSVMLQSEEYNLSREINMNDRTGLRIQGSGHISTISCNQTGAGLGFQFTSHITLVNIRFIGCGAARNSSSRGQGNQYQLFSVALYFIFCSHIHMLNVSITKSNGTALVLYSSDGKNRFKGCTFSNNTPSQDSKLAGGGGVNVEFIYCIPGDIDCLTSGQSAGTTPHSSHATYVFDSCYFSYNNATTNFVSNSFVVPFASYLAEVGRGGGLSVFINGYAMNNTINITNCYITHNTAVWGAGFETIFGDSAQGNLVHIDSIQVTDNACQYNELTYQGTGGGGARIQFAGFNSTVVHNKMTFTNVTFANNRAYFGGGVSFFTFREQGVEIATNEIEFRNCTWIGNTARLGSAIDLSIWHEAVNGVASVPLLVDCSIMDNSIDYTSTLGTPSGIGTIYTDSISLSLQGKLQVMNNVGNGIASLNAGLLFSANTQAIFFNNTGRNGGGVSLFSYAYMEVQNGTVLHFTQNKAHFLGGAIYWESTGGRELISSRNCFIRHKNEIIDPNKWPVQFIFTNNTAKLSGQAIFATTLLTCLWGGLPYGDLDIPQVQYDEVFCWNNYSEVWHYGLGGCTANIATNGGFFAMNQKDNLQRKSDLFHLDTIPGEYKPLPVAMTDDRGKKVPLNLQIYSITVPDHNFQTYLANSYFNFLPSKGEENNPLEVTISSIEPRVVGSDIIIHFQKCPPGYALKEVSRCNDASISCMECRLAKFPFVKSNGTLLSQMQRGFWIGYYNTSDKNDTAQSLLLGACYFCGTVPSTDAQEYILLNQNPDKLDNQICQPLNRTGVLCGECINGFGPAMNSKFYRCVECPEGIENYSWILFLLSEITPITIFLAIVIFFNISVTSGPGNAFVFFAQIISSTFGVDSEGTINYNIISSASFTLQDVYISVYGIWNLNFFDNIEIFQYCLSRKINTLQIRCLEYLSASYPLIFLALISVILTLRERQNRVVVWLTKPLHFIFARFRRRWSFDRSIVDAFATFLILSFTKFAIISSFNIYPAELYNENGTVEEKVCYIYGKFGYFSREYAPYLIISLFIFCTICIVIPSTLLLYSLKPFYNLLARFNIKFLHPGPKFQQFLNAFYNSFKDGSNGTRDLRFFASLYFGVRILLVMVNSVAPNWSTQYLMQQVICTIGILLFGMLQPYKNNFYNLLDAASFTLLALINVISFYNRYLVAINQSPSALTYWIQVTLIYFPLLYICVYLTCYFCHANKNTIQKVVRKVCCCGQHPPSNWVFLSSARFEQSFNGFMDDMVSAGEWRGTNNYYGPLTEDTNEVISDTVGQDVSSGSIELLTSEHSEGMDKQEDLCPLHVQSPQTDTSYGTVSSTVSIQYNLKVN